MWQRIFAWLDERFPLSSIWKKYFTEYYVPKNLNFFYLFGSIALVVLVNQFLSGLWLAMFYTPNTEYAFASIEYLMREVPWGWLFRYLHSTGASALFIVMYLHIMRGLLYGSYKKPRELVWLLGMLLYLIVLLEAFFGYLLPWGQMSYWGAQVITSLFSVVPYVGDFIVSWLRGDYLVANPTLQRFFALHVIGLPLLLVFFVVLHLIALRQVGSNNPEGIEIKDSCDSQGIPLDGIAFHPYYTMKDLMGILLFAIFFFAIVFFVPDMGGYFLEPSNFILANTLSTPDEIVPLWYMAPFYAILRAVPNQVFGVGCMVLALIILFFLPWLDKSLVRSWRYRGYYSRVSLMLLVISFILLGYLGLHVVTPGRLMMARICIVIYFSYFLLMPIYTQLERCHVVPQRIS